MSWPYVLYVMKRRWWLVLATVAVAVAGSLVYTHVQRRLYQASATTFAYPIAQNANDATNSVGLLTYGNMADTFASLAQSRYYLAQAGATLGLSTRDLDLYSVKAATLPQTTVLQVSVIGPDPRTVAQLADRLTLQVGIGTEQYFRVFGLHALDHATAPLSPVQPKPLQQALYALVAGLLVGFAVAAVSLRVQSSAAGVPVPISAAPAAEETAAPVPAAPVVPEPAPPVPVTPRQKMPGNIRRLSEMLPVEDGAPEPARGNGQ
jgi:capsular polysaccharide biosynthesis protein